MLSKTTQAMILSGCLMVAGAASANDRSVIVPVIAGAAVGAVLATVISKSSHHDRAMYDYRPQPRYQPQYQPVRYIPVGPRVEYRRFAPPPPRPYYGRGYDRGYERGYNRGHDRHFDHGREYRRW